MLKYVRKAKIVRNSKDEQDQFLTFVTLMEARTENLSDINLSIWLSMQIHNFWAPTRVVGQNTAILTYSALGHFYASSDHRDHKVDQVQVEIALTGPPWDLLVIECNKSECASIILLPIDPPPFRLLLTIRLCRG